MKYCWIAAAAMMAATSPSLAEAPLWRKLNSNYFEYQIFVDPRIVADSRLAFLPQQALDKAESDVRKFLQNEEKAKKEGQTPARNDGTERLHLLSLTDQYVAILKRDGSCSIRCYTGDSVVIYQIATRTALKTRDVVDLDANRALLNRLAERDKNQLIGPAEAACELPSGKSDDSGEPDCLPLHDIMVRSDAETSTIRFRSSREVHEFEKGVDVGFTSDDKGLIKTLDIYFSSDRKFPGHFQAYRWSIGIDDAAPLLKIALRAADTKPDFAIKTKFVEVTVTLDDKIKADPALTADCLAEGKKWAATRKTEAHEERRRGPELFRNAWSYDRKYETRSVVADRYVSIIRGDYEYTGGAHPNSSSNTILWDKSAGKRISIRPFFTETADNGPTLKAMRQAVIASLKEEKKARGAEGLDSMAIEAIEPKLLKIGPVALAPSTEDGKSSGLNFYYDPYAVGSYAEGEYVAFVPWEALKPYLTPEGARIFGGARPRDDKDSGK